MNGRTVWPPILAAVALVWWIEPANSVAQAPPPSTGTVSTKPRAPALVSRAVAAANTVKTSTGPSPSSSAPVVAGARTTRPKVTSPRIDVGTAELPSTVSPTIARFIREHGHELPVLTGAVPVPQPGCSSASAPAGGSPERLIHRTAQAAPARATAPGANGIELPGGTAALDVKIRLKSAPLEPSDVGFPINLATALRLSDARPLIIAAAQAGVWVAEAELTHAKVLWVPMAILGVDYLRHDGGGPDFNKGVMTAPSTNYFDMGPAAILFVNVTDAYFQPLVARQMLNARHWETQAAKNDALMQTADAYFRVHQYRGMYAGALYTVERGRDLVEKVANLARELVPEDEVARARNMLADLEQRAVFDRQEWRVASADLTQVLRLDPRAVIVPVEHDHIQITLVDPALSFDDLMPIALHNRPELASREAQVVAAETVVRREKMRPFLPTLLLGGFQTPAMYIQAGLFGLGPNSSLNQWVGREDVSAQMIWQLDAFGIGNLARIKGARGDQSKAIVELRNMQDTVAADVNRALSRVQSAAARVLQADRALRTAIITFNGHLEGLEQTRRLENVLVLTFRPQEAVYSLQQMNVSFEEYFTTVAEYNRAQFELFHALGYPARELSIQRPPGDVEPVNTARPAYLPPVGNGPPPAAR